MAIATDALAATPERSASCMAGSLASVIGTRVRLWVQTCPDALRLLREGRPDKSGPTTASSDCSHLRPWVVPADDECIRDTIAKKKPPDQVHIRIPVRPSIAASIRQFSGGTMSP